MMGARRRILRLTVFLLIGLLDLATFLSSATAQTAPAIPRPLPAREVELENRLRKMEAMNARMAEQLESVVNQNKALARQLKAVARRSKEVANKVDDLTTVGPPAPSSISDTTGTDGMADDDDALNLGLGDDDDQPEDVLTDEPAPPEGAPGAPTTGEGGDAGAGGSGSGGMESEGDDQPEDIRTDEPQPTGRIRPSDSFFDDGFKWSTEDGEYELQFHNETQLDIRAYEQANSSPVDQTGFYINRMRFYFNGRLTKPIEYSVSLSKGIGDLDLLDAYLNFNYDSRFQVRIGRYRVPFTYDWYALSNQFLPTPERSIFALNYGYNRNFAIMGHGELFDERVDYAVAGVNGVRNSYFDENSHKDVLAYVNYRPFMQSERFPALKHLNIGGSLAYGIQDQAPVPRLFRTYTSASNSPGQIMAGPTFLELNDDVYERGARKQWELHAAYFYKGLTLMAAWDVGLNTYGVGEGGGAPSVPLPTNGYHAQFAYLLTGEHLERRYFITPLRPFDLRKGKFGLGAFEVQARYAHFAVGDQVFTGGLADPNLWTDNVNVIDAGVNWYLNKYTKIYFDWQHTMYGQPVPYRPGGLQTTSDLFWLRFQIYF